MARYAQSILDIVCSSGKHMTAEQIFLLLKEQHPAVVLATVYNNLNTLTEQGKIRRIRAEGFPDRYDTSKKHDHLVCTCCGRLEDVNLPDMTPFFESRAHVPVAGYDLKLLYTCDACRAAMGG